MTIEGEPRLSRSPEIVPEWLANLSALAWRVVAVGALLVIAWLIASLLWTVTASIAVAIVIAAFFAPGALALRRRGRSPAAAAAIVWVVALSVVLGAVLLLAFALLPYVVDLLGRLEQAADAVSAALASLNVPAAVGTAIHGLVSLLRERSDGALSSIAESAAGGVTIGILAAFLVFFFLKDGDKAWLWLFQAVNDENRTRITEAGEDALSRVGGYLRGTTVLAAIMAVTDYAFLWILGVPLAAPLAILVFFTGYIPYLGGILANLVLLGVAYAAVGVGPALVLLALIAVRNVILAYGLRPAVYRRTVSIHPALVLVALPAGFELAGIVGMFAAVPFLAIVFAVAQATAAILDPGPGRERPVLVPGWLDRVAQWAVRILVSLAMLALGVGVLVSMPLVVIPLILAAILAATLEPGVQALMRRGRSRGRAAVIVTGGGFLALVLILGLTVYTLIDQASALGAGAVGGAQTTDASTGGRVALVVQAVVQGGSVLVQSIVAVGQSLATVAVIVVLSTLLAFYLLLDGGRAWTRIVTRARPEIAGDLDGAARRAVEVLGGYMIGTGVISFVGAASQLVIMLLLGIPLAVPVFVLSFILCFIPYIGGFISTGLALLLTIAYGSPEAIAVMVVWTIVFNLVTGNIVSPLVYGKTVHLHPAIVLVAIPAGAAVAGILGMFVVVPTLGVVAATWRSVLGIIGQRRHALKPGGSPAPEAELPARQPVATIPGEAAPSG